jgi:hypothetical protein
LSRGEDTQISIDSENIASTTSLHADSGTKKAYDWLDEDVGFEEFGSRDSLKEQNSPQPTSTAFKIIMGLCVWILLSLPALISIAIRTLNDRPESVESILVERWSLFLSLNWVMGMAVFWSTKCFVSVCHRAAFGEWNTKMEALREVSQLFVEGMVTSQNVFSIHSTQRRWWCGGPCL